MNDFPGELEQMLILAVLRLGSEAYGRRIVEELDERVGRSVSRGSLYVTLDRLEAKGFLRSRLAGPTPARGGRRKRNFELTEAGVMVARRARSNWMRLWEGYEGVLDRA